MITNINEVLKAKEELAENLKVLLQNFTNNTGWEINSLDFAKRQSSENLEYFIDPSLKYKKLIIDSSYKKVV